MVRRSALSREPNKPQTGGGLTQSLQRLSPGVYRDAGGRLTNQGGRPLPQQPNRMAPQQPIFQPAPMPSSNIPGVVSGVTGIGNLPGSYRPGFGPSDFGNAVAWQQQGSPFDFSYQRSPSWQRPPMPPQQMQQPQFLQNQALQGAGIGADAALQDMAAKYGENYNTITNYAGGSPGFYDNRMQQMYQPIQGFQNAPGYMPQQQQQQQMPTRQQLLRKF